MMKKTLHNELLEKHPSLKYEIGNDFVGVFDGIFSENLCKTAIHEFEVRDKIDKTYNRIQGFDRQPHVVSDSSIDFRGHAFYEDLGFRYVSDEFSNVFWSIAYPLYREKYSILNTYARHEIFTVKLQRTKPGEGYHVWHSEDMARHECTRVAVFILYLNDIDEGGETEFLYLNKRIKPEAGRLIIWPAGFTHTHRGNPPIGDKEKYILTGWVEL